LPFHDAGNISDKDESNAVRNFRLLLGIYRIIKKGSSTTFRKEFMARIHGNLKVPK
jgi:hypothetical protein